MNPRAVDLTKLHNVTDDPWSRHKTIRLVTNVSHDGRFNPKPLHIDADDSEVSI